MSVKIPDKAITLSEAGHRLGVTSYTISKWGRLGYFPLYRRPGKRYVFWFEIMQNNLMRRELVNFLERLRDEEHKEIPVKEHNDPRPQEQAYATERKR